MSVSDGGTAVEQYSRVDHFCKILRDSALNAEQQRFTHATASLQCAPLLVDNYTFGADLVVIDREYGPLH